MKSRLFLFAGAALFAAAGCSTAQRERSEQRDKVSVSSGYYCGFINGDEYHDVEVQLNLELAKRCDSNKSSTITNYKNSAELFGIVYCCTLKKDEPVAKRPEHSAPPKAELHDSTAPKADAKSATVPAALAKPPPSAPATGGAKAAAAAPAKPAAPAEKPAAPKADKDDGIAD